ncbi:MAG: lysozyme inhibitor LprI family protein [Gallionellaceae bacterium]|nr:lysozyme inhibitor LprI family protein [Gallionellaceae bacterium]
MKHAIYILVIAITLALPTHALAASFDCNRASSAVETMICADPRLSELDELLAGAYREVLSGEHPEETKHAQRSWIQERNQCADAQCVKAAYQERLAALSSAQGQQTTAAAESPETPPVPEEQDETRVPEPATPLQSPNEPSTPEVMATDTTQTSVPVVTSSTISADVPSVRPNKDWMTLLVWAVVISFVILMFLGVSNRVVIFYNPLDLAISMGAILATPLGFLIASTLDDKLASVIAVSTGGVISAGLMVVSFVNAIRYNHSLLLGIFVGCFKILASGLGVLILVSQLVDDGSKRDRNRPDYAKALTILVLGYIASLLINGERVTELRLSAATKS